ncbi:chloride channel, nucleotide-sensitive, 1A, putative [Eimeria praecox]|uniref:Chloride channel, nucleotide-sensitive, 1A, putative n=1 Tax=Eimeria praecox TaxID=51316 RepID=U6GME4_9EIME|nr:chloride channel, nucleotide-sensitive, 1A, putative [Eimeria praecox]
MMASAPHRTSLGDLELQENETVGIRVPCTSIVISGKDSGCGELFVTSQRVVWLSGTGPSFALNYVNIVLHALSTDPRVATSESIETPEEADESADDDAVVELKFIPDDSSCLQRLFTVMSEMAALHPDPDSGTLDGDEDELFDEAALRRQVLLS